MPGEEAVRYVLSTEFGKSAAGDLAVEGVKLVNEDAGNLLAGVLELWTADDDPAVLDNPYFAQNGHDGESPNTRNYLQQKKVTGVVGTLGKNLLDIGGVTSASSGLQHSLVWYRINALFTKMIPASRRAKPPEYAAWYSWTVAKKAVPAGSLEIQMTRILRQKMYSAVGNATQAGIAFGTGGLMGIFVNASCSQLQGKLDSLFGQDVQTLAQGFHWHAFRESVVGGTFGGGKGPAWRILEVVWEQFGIGHGIAHSMDDIVREPCGWLVIADLLS